MDGRYNNIKIAGMAAATPEYCLDNRDFSEIFGERKTIKQIKVTGVVKHHVINGFQKTSDMCVVATRKLLEHLGWNPQDVKVFILVTQSEDYGIPSTSFEMCYRMGFSSDCMTYDINLGCSGFDNGIQTVAALLQSQPDGTKAILCTGEMSPGIDLVNMNPQNMANQMMFGAGGTSTALVKEAGNDLCFSNYSYGDGYIKICSQAGAPLIMDGMAVVEFADHEVSDNIRDFIDKNKISDDKVDGYILHQAQKMMIDTIMLNCNMPQDKVFTSYEEYGNTSSASIPVTICHNAEKFKDKDKVSFITCGYGVGLSVGITYWSIDSKNILPVIHSDEHFDDHIGRRYYLYNRSAILYGAKSPVIQMLGRELDVVGCELGAMGNKEELSDFIDSLFYKKTVLVGQEFEEVKRESGYDAIIFDNELVDIEEIGRECEKIQNLGFFNSKPLLVIVGKDLSDVEKYKKFREKGFRIAKIEYDPQKVDFYPNEYGNKKWVERRLLGHDTQSMANAIKIGRIIADLLVFGHSGVGDALIKMSGE